LWPRMQFSTVGFPGQVTRDPRYSGNRRRNCACRQAGHAQVGKFGALPEITAGKIPYQRSRPAHQSAVLSGWERGRPTIWREYPQAPRLFLAVRRVCGERRIVGAQSHSSMCAAARLHLPVPALMPTPSLWRATPVKAARSSGPRGERKMIPLSAVDVRKDSRRPSNKVIDSFEKMAGKAGGRA
jgi:hypothetical protein